MKAAQQSQHAHESVLLELAHANAAEMHAVQTSGHMLLTADSTQPFQQYGRQKHAAKHNIVPSSVWLMAQQHTIAGCSASWNVGAGDPDSWKRSGAK